VNGFGVTGPERLAAEHDGKPGAELSDPGHRIVGAALALELARGHFASAETLFVSGMRMRQKLLGDAHPYVAESARQLVTLYAAWRRPERGREYEGLVAGR